MIILLFLQNNTVIFIFLDMKCHVHLWIILPRSNSRGKEGHTRCVSIFSRYSNGSWYWHCWALEFCSGSSRRVCAAGVGSKLMLASSRAGEFSTGSLFGLIYCESCSTCLHLSQPSAKGGIREMDHINHMFSTYFETHTSWALAHYTHQSKQSATRMYTVRKPLSYPSTHCDCGL